MNRDLLDLTSDQLKVYKALQIERRAWFALISLIILVAVGFVAFLSAAFTDRPTATVISGVALSEGDDRERAITGDLTTAVY